MNHSNLLVFSMLRRKRIFEIAVGLTRMKANARLCSYPGMDIGRCYCHNKSMQNHEDRLHGVGMVNSRWQRTCMRECLHWENVHVPPGFSICRTLPLSCMQQPRSPAVRNVWAHWGSGALSTSLSPCRQMWSQILKIRHLALRCPKCGVAWSPPVSIKRSVPRVGSLFASQLSGYSR